MDVHVHHVYCVLESTKIAANRSIIANDALFAPQYLSELALQDADPYLKYYPSVIAASAICLARHTMAQLAWVRLHSMIIVSTCYSLYI